MSRNITQLTAPAVAPHAHGGGSVSRTMHIVQAALIPATLYSFWLYGWPAIILWTLTVGFCLMWEGLALRLAGQAARRHLLDGSAVLTGWLLALTLPPWAPWWVAFVGSFIAIVFAKQMFGGLGQNVFNPAMVARVALLVSFPVPLTLWVAPMPLFSAGAPGFLDSLAIILGAAAIPDALTSASLLGHTKTELSRGVDLLHSMAALPGGAALSWCARQGALTWR